MRFIITLDNSTSLVIFILADCSQRCISRLISQYILASQKDVNRIAFLLPSSLARNNYVQTLFNYILMQYFAGSHYTIQYITNSDGIFIYSDRIVNKDCIAFSCLVSRAFKFILSLPLSSFIQRPCLPLSNYSQSFCYRCSAQKKQIKN